MPTFEAVVGEIDLTPEAPVIAPRLLTRSQAAQYCGLSPEGFSAWVGSGRMPPPIRGTRRWDRAAIDIVLDQLSGVMRAESPPVNVFDEWKAMRNARPPQRNQEH
jgi:hypothetical protein